MRDSARVYIHGHSVGGTNPTLVEAIESRLPVLSFDTRFNREVLGSGGSYFTNTENLTSLIDSATWVEPRSLPMEYSWEYICAGYLELLKRLS